MKEWVLDCPKSVKRCTKFYLSLIVYTNSFEDAAKFPSMYASSSSRIKGHELQGFMFEELGSLDFQPYC